MSRDSALAERLKDEVGGLARKVGVVRGWHDFRKSGGHVPISAQPFVLESVRNAFELAALKVHHLAVANSSGDVSFNQFVAQFDVATRDPKVDDVRTRLKGLRKSAYELTKYRDDFVAHPDVAVPDLSVVSLLKIADEVFAVMHACQGLMVGGMNYDGEVETWQKSTVKSLQGLSSGFKIGAMD